MEVRIGDSIECNPTVKLVKGNEYPLIDIDKISVGRKLVTNKDTIVYEKQSGCKFQNGDTLMARITPCLENGKMAMASIPDKGIGSTELFVFRGKKGITDNDFVYYFLKQSYIRNLAANSMTGASGRQRADLKFIKKIKFDLPSLPTQQKIASILSAYDRLIENNTRRIRLLEQIAENLYKEWFSYRKIKGQSKAVKLKEIINITRGLSYSSEEIDCTDGNNLINLKNIQGYGGFRLDGTKLYKGKYKPEQIVEEGDLIMGVTDMTQDRRTVGSVALIPNVNTLSVISADLVKINSSIDNTYLYAMFRYGNVSRHIAQFANGANVLHLRPKSILNIKVFLPNQDIIDSFVSKVKPMIQLTNRLNTEIDSLTRQRDLLLPRLMSGKLEVNLNQPIVL